MAVLGIAVAWAVVWFAYHVTRYFGLALVVPAVIATLWVMRWNGHRCEDAMLDLVDRARERRERRERR